MSDQYTPDGIKLTVSNDCVRLFASYSANRPPNWSCDQRTVDLVCIGIWLDEEMQRIGLDDLGRRTQTAQFNRRSRSEDDLWVLAANIMNDTLNDNIDRFRRPHRRWG